MKRRRMYFLLPDVQRARAVFKELLLERIEERHIHVLAREGTPLADLPEASVLQKSDAVHASTLGLLAGAATGALIGFILWRFPPAGLAELMGIGVVLALAALGAIMGVWASGIIGASTPNTDIEKFQPELDRGKVLMMVDVPADKADEISRLLKQQHPEADLRFDLASTH